MLSYVNRAMAKQLTGVAYLGNTIQSAKTIKNKKKGVDTYMIYLSPTTLSGYNTCPMATKDCINACLNESGQNRINMDGRINRSRITKTKLFFEQRDFFMQWVIDEMKAHRNLAKNRGYEFSVRLNGTSDISPVQFKLNNKTLLDYFPDVQFYDYTKVFNRSELLTRYNNYDLTYSFSGSNWAQCENALSKGMRVAMVFEKVPAFYKGIPVINADDTDLRYMDPNCVIAGLKFKQVRKKIDFTKQKFIIQANDQDCTF